jgi:hypothetical protein
MLGGDQRGDSAWRIDQAFGETAARWGELPAVEVDTHYL